TLINGAQQFGFDVQVLKHQQALGSKISSSNIRTLLSQGKLTQVSQLIGKPFSICARVAHGAKRGTSIGFPTANLAFHPASKLLQGVFATKVTVNNKQYQGVANSGTRPTVDGLKHVSEVHILNFEGDLYGKKITVEFLHKLRDEQRFDNIEKLKQQINVDVQNAKAFFAQYLLPEID
ncbi:MAG: riboflavin kinase, partial [Candidatus Berkiella sp.]